MKHGFKYRSVISVVCAAGLIVSACATTDSNGRPLSALDRSINQCIGSVVVGAMLGALIGGATDHKAGRGALVGAGVGGVACAVFVAMNNAQDKERVRQSQINAARTGLSQKANYIGDDGQARTIQTTAEPTAIPVSLTNTAPAAGPAITGPCRKTRTQITVQNAGTAALSPETVCRNSSGDYVTVSGSTET